MSSFHKPKVYRSTQGCCICKAKSSSSRFTDSKKYENDFMKCFQLTAPRRGEICNACVLLVKRFKRLPTGSDRHWGHVVDARVGPGLKSMTKFKKRKEESLKHNAEQNGKSQSNRLCMSEEFSKIFKKSKKKKFIEKREQTPGSSDEQSLPPSPTSFNFSDSEENQFGARHKSRSKNNSKLLRITKDKRLNKRKNCRPRKNFRSIENFNFFDDNEWIRIKSCCGIVYENQEIGALIMDETSAPCSDHKEYFTRVYSAKRISVNNENKTENQQIPNNNHNNYNTIQNNINHTYLVQKQHETGGNIHATLPVLKKHHLFLKRQMENVARIESNVPNLHKTDTSSVTPTSSAVTAITEYRENLNELSLTSDVTMNSIVTSVSDNINQSNKTLAYLHKTKPDFTKVMKHSVDKVATARLKPSELNVVKSFVKVSSSEPKTAKLKPIIDEKLEILLRNKQIDPTNNKFSDNSSDSGYEESCLLEQKGVAVVNSSTNTPIQQIHKGKVQSIVRPVILANGIKLHVQPQNLVLAANLAGLSQSAVQQPHTQLNTKSNETDDNRAIYGSCSPSSISSTSSLSPSPPHDGLAVSITGANSITQMVHTMPAGTNQKIILLKTKYSNNGNSAAAANN